MRFILKTSDVDDESGPLTLVLVNISVWLAFLGLAILAYVIVVIVLAVVFDVRLSGFWQDIIFPGLPIVIVANWIVRGVLHFSVRHDENVLGVGA